MNKEKQEAIFLKNRKLKQGRGGGGAACRVFITHSAFINSKLETTHQDRS